MIVSMNRELLAPVSGFYRFTRQLVCLCLAFLIAANWVANAQSKAQSGPPIELGVATNNNLTLPRSALGKEFLMSASRLPQAVAATSYGLAGKIVRFELFHDGVDLYEATEGLLVTKDLPARRLLTTFPIVEQDANRVVIDFNRGMRRLYTEFWAAYGRSFNPASPLANCLQVNDDTAAAADRCPSFTGISVPSGATRVYVLTTFGNGVALNYEVTFAGTTPVSLQSFDVE